MKNYVDVPITDDCTNFDAFDGVCIICNQCGRWEEKESEMKISHSDIDYIVQIVDDVLYSELIRDEYDNKSVSIEEEIKYRLQELID